MIMLGMVRVSTTLLIPAEYGKLSVVTAITALISLMLISPVGLFFNRGLHSWVLNKKLGCYLGYYWIYLFWIAIFSCFAITATGLVSSLGVNIGYVWVWVLVGGGLAFNTASATIISFLNLLGRRRLFVGLTISSLIAGFLFATLLVSYVNPSAEYWLLGVLIGQALFAAVGNNILLRVTKSKLSCDIGLTNARVMGLFNYAWPASLALVFGWVQTQGFRFVVPDLLGLHYLGLFVAGYAISVGIVSGFESVLGAYFQPDFYKKVSLGQQAEREAAWANYASAMLPALVLLVLFIVALAPELTRLLLGQDYSSSSKYIVWGAIVEAARVVMAIYTLAAHSQMMTRTLISPNLLGAIVSIGALFFLVGEFGVEGIGMSLAASGILSALLMRFSLKRKLNLYLPYNKIVHATVFGLLGYGLLVLIKSHVAGSTLLSAVLWVLAGGIIWLFLVLWINRSMFYPGDPLKLR